MGKGKAGSGGSRNSLNVKEFRMFLKNRMWRDYKFVLLGCLGLIAAIFISAILQFQNTPQLIQHINSSDKQLMNQVFKSGEPWVVLCTNSNEKLPEVVQKASKRIVKRKIKMAVMDCTEKLPSGKTVYQRFQLNTQTKPVVFTVANGGKPQQIYVNYLQTGKAFAKRVVEQTKKRLTEFQSSEQLESGCFRKSVCVVILRGIAFRPYERQWIATLMSQFRKVQFGYVDSTTKQLSIESSLLKYEDGKHRMIVFKQNSTEDGKVLTARSYRADFQYMPVKQFLQSSMKVPFKKLKKTPTMKKRRRIHPARANRQPANKQEQKPKDPKEVERERRERMDALEKEHFPQKSDETDQKNQQGEEEEEEVIDLD